LQRCFYAGGRPNLMARLIDRGTAAVYARGVDPEYLVALRHGRREEVHLQEVVAPDLRAPVLKAYLKRATNASAHMPIEKDAPLAEYERLAPRFPVVYRVINTTLIPAILLVRACWRGLFAGPAAFGCSACKMSGCMGSKGP
jgi:hypothetical protein